jgi:guanidinobutyrase / D-arginase
VLDVQPFAELQVVDAGDSITTPYSITAAVNCIQEGAHQLLERVARLVTIGGDHTIALPLLREAFAKHGPIAVVHFDAHLDTWDAPTSASRLHMAPRFGELSRRDFSNRRVHPRRHPRFALWCDGPQR